MALLRKLAAKQKLDREQAQLKQELRLEKRRGYAKTAAERARLRKLADGGLLDLPPEVAVRIEEQLKTPAGEPEPPKVVDAATVEELVARLTAIRERLFHLSAVFAVSLSWDCAIESNKYLAIFQELAADLQQKDERAYELLVAGHESILLSPTIQVKQSVPLDLQRDAELRWEISQMPARRAPVRNADSVPDGLGWML